MKSIRLIPLVGLFIICLFLGFQAGRHVASSPDGTNESKGENPNSISREYPLPEMNWGAEFDPSISTIEISDNPPHESEDKPLQFARPSGNGQLNLLAIGVDHLVSPQPNLESLWLIVFSPDVPHLMFLPIYPTSLDGRASDDSGEPLVVNFALDTNGDPDQGFRNILKARGIWWDTFILVDEAGISNIMQLFSKVKSGQQTDDGGSPNKPRDGQVDALGKQDSAIFIEALTPPNSNFPLNQRDQYKLIQEVCLRSVSTSPVAIAREAFQLIRSSPEHIHTDLTFRQIIDLWHGHQESQMGFSCEFPSLATAQFQ